MTVDVADEVYGVVYVLLAVVDESGLALGAAGASAVEADRGEALAGEAAGQVREQAAVFAVAG